MAMTVKKIFKRPYEEIFPKILKPNPKILKTNVLQENFFLLK